MSSVLAPGDFANPNSVVGSYSAGPVVTKTSPNFEAVPNRFSNDLVYVGSNTYGGTVSNVQAAKGKFVRLTGGSRRLKRGGDSTGSTDREETTTTGGPEPDDEPNVITDTDGTALNEDGEPCRLCELGDESDHIHPSQVCAACQRDYFDQRGGRKVFGRNNKMNGGSRLGMDLENASASVGSIGAGHPGHKAVNHSAPRQNQPDNQVPDSLLTGGKRRRRTKNKRSRKMKTKRHHRKTKGRKSRGRKTRGRKTRGRKSRGRKVHKKRHTRKGRKMRGGSVETSCGCVGGSRKKRHSSKNRRSKKRGAGSCGNYMKGGSPQPFSNEPLSFGYSFNGAPINPNDSALASPMPFKPYYACEKVARN